MLESLAGGELGEEGEWRGSPCWLQVWVLPNQTWICLPDTQQSQSADTGGGEGKHSVYSRVPRKENGQLVLQRLEFPDGFQGRVFKGNI